MSEKISAHQRRQQRQRSEIRSSNERQQAESIIRGRIRRSKRLGRGLALVAVAAGVTLGVSNRPSEPQVIASEAALVGSMVAAGANERKTRRRCDGALIQYAAALRRGVGLAAPVPSAIAPGEKSSDGRPAGGRLQRLIKRTDKITLPFGTSMMPFIAGVGASELADYAKNGGPLLPQHFLGHAHAMEPGIALGSLEVAMGVGFLSLAGASTASEKAYFEQLDEIDGTSIADPLYGIMNDQPVGGV